MVPELPAAGSNPDLPIYYLLAEGPGVAYNTPATHECPQKNFSLIGPAVWPAIGNIYIYECLVLLYR